MKYLSVDSNLTKSGGDNQVQAHSTFVGQAHFAGSGPDGQECRSCSHATVEKKSPKDGSIKLISCSKFRELMRTRDVKTFHPRAHACKYFEEGKPNEQR